MLLANPALIGLSCRLTPILPFCEQDAVWNVRLKSSPTHRFAMCFECDSVWLENQTVSDKAGTTFDKYNRELGIEPDWENIEKLDMIE